MAMSVTRTDSVAHNGILRIKLAWVTAADGSATKALGYICGKILALITDPGSTAPSDNYDITLPNGDGVDMLNGAGVDRDTANTEYVCPSINLGDGTVTKIPMPIADDVTFTIANGGDSKVGTAYIYVEVLSNI